MSEPASLSVVSPFTTSANLGDVTVIRTATLRMRHQAPGPFAIDYRGDSPVLLVLLSTASPTSGHSGCGRGGFALLTPGAPVQIDAAEDLEVLALAFDEPSMVDLAALGEDAVHRGFDPGVKTLAQEARRILLHEAEGSEAYLDSLGQGLLVRALQVLRDQKRNASRESVTAFNVRRVSAHVESRLSERISVDELAGVAGLSRAHFSRAFVAVTGETPHQFVLSKRLAFVRRKLKEGAANLSLIAAAAGFSSHAHMTAAFRDAFGMTPREYREAHMQAPADVRRQNTLARLAG